MQIRFILIAGLGFSLWSTAAQAQETEAPLDETYAIANLEEGAPSLLEALPEAPKKIPDAALGLSMGLTALSFVVGGELAGIGENANLPTLRLVGLGVFSAGLVLFPSSGHLYAQDIKQVRRGVGVRAGAVLLSSSMLYLASKSDSTAIDSVSLGVAGVMGALTLISSVRDVADGEDAVRRYNKTSR